MIFEWALEAVPEAGEKLTEEARLEEARKMLRRVLKARGLALAEEEELPLSRYMLERHATEQEASIPRQGAGPLDPGERRIRGIRRSQR